MDLLTLRDPEGLSLSPDGRNVAFVVGQAVYETNGYRSGLFVVSTSGHREVRSFGSAGLPHWDDINQWVPEAPEWSPDSRMIWYRMRMSAREHWQVWGWNLASGQRKQITHVSGDVESYSAAPDGHTLFLTVLKHRANDESAEGYSPGIPFNKQIRPSVSIPILTQMREAEEPIREFWVHDLSTNRDQQEKEEEIQKYIEHISSIVIKK
jgi:dipeptidyl aminopeptidase/acylaminoacyl peptidase